jgi:hypothetical protein
VQSLCQPAPVGEQNGGVGADCGLHPLIHTLPKFNLPQDIESIESGAEALHFLSLNQGIVAWSQKVKCGVCNSHFQQTKTDE